MKYVRFVLVLASLVLCLRCAPTNNQANSVDLASEKAPGMAVIPAPPATEPPPAEIATLTPTSAVPPQPDPTGVSIAAPALQTEVQNSEERQ